MSDKKTSLSKEQLDKGHEVLTRVYGKQAADYITSEAGTPYTDETIGKLFGLARRGNQCRCDHRPDTA